MKPKIRSLIVAFGQQNLVISNKGEIPWYLPKDFKHFQNTTKKISEENPKGIEGIPLIMGRKNYESIPQKFRPLPGRTNIILSRQSGWSPQEESPNIMVTNSLWKALDYAEQMPGDEIFCIGGEEVYEFMIKEVVFHKLYLTSVSGYFEGDRRFPLHLLKIAERYQQKKEEVFLKDENHDYPFTIRTYELI